MKILILTPSLHRTGSEVCIFNIGLRLKRYGYEIVFSANQRGKLVEELSNAGIPFYLNLPKNTILRYLFSYIYKIVNDNYFVRLINACVKPDIWLVNTCIQPGLLRLAEKMNVKVILYAHEMEQMFVGLKKQDVIDLVRIPSKIIACSQDVKSNFTMLGREEKDIAIAFPGIETPNISLQGKLGTREALGIPSSAFVWVMSGTIDPNKQPLLFLRIAECAAQNGYDFFFVWIGDSDGGYSYFVKEYLKTKALSNVLFTGHVNHETFSMYLNVSDGFLFTSHIESFSIVVVEALAMGKPVVSHATGISKYIIDASCGFLIESDNPNDYLDKMCKIASGSIQFDGVQIKKKASPFDYETSAKIISEIINELE